MLPTVSSQCAPSAGGGRRSADVDTSSPQPADAPAAGAFGAVLAEQNGAADTAAGSRSAAGDSRAPDQAAASGETGGAADGNVRQASGKDLPARSTQGASALQASALDSPVAPAATAPGGEPLPGAAIALPPVWHASGERAATGAPLPAPPQAP
ncbi:MAG: hypothetical protein KDI01_04435, partial [Halioglobus sp.]|nr:hypothetical protein [Halioglobus sp.]